MHARELPPEEWDRLMDTGFGAIRHLLHPGMMRIMVVEDDDGRIVGTWSIQQWVHVEGLWVAPGLRGRGVGVFRALVRLMRTKLAEIGVTAPLTGAADSQMEQWLKRLRATEVPGKTYTLPMGKIPVPDEVEPCQQQL